MCYHFTTSSTCSPKNSIQFQYSGLGVQYCLLFQFHYLINLITLFLVGSSFPFCKCYIKLIFSFALSLNINLFALAHVCKLVGILPKKKNGLCKKKTIDENCRPCLIMVEREVFAWVMLTTCVFVFLLNYS